MEGGGRVFSGLGIGGGGRCSAMSWRRSSRSRYWRWCRRRRESTLRAVEGAAFAAVSEAAGPDSEPRHLLAGVPAARSGGVRGVFGRHVAVLADRVEGCRLPRQTARRSFEGRGGAGPMHLISAFAAKATPVLGSGIEDDKQPCRRTVLAIGPVMSLDRVGARNSHVVEPCWRPTRLCRRTVLAAGPVMSSNCVGDRADYVVQPCWRPGRLCH